jgi:hypothetical protein
MSGEYPTSGEPLYGGANYVPMPDVEMPSAEQLPGLTDFSVAGYALEAAYREMAEGDDLVVSSHGLLASMLEEPQVDTRPEHAAVFREIATRLNGRWSGNGPETHSGQ